MPVLFGITLAMSVRADKKIESIICSTIWPKEKTEVYGVR